MGKQSLLEVLGLPPRPEAAASGNGGHGQAFRDAVANVNGNLRVVAAQAAPKDREALDAQRARLYEAYHVAASRSDPGRSQQAIQRVLAAAGVVEERTSAAAANAASVREAWSQRESELDAAMLQIGELEEAGHDKAPVLRQLGEAIRTRAHENRYQDAVSALDQLSPRLSEIYRAHQQQSGDEAAEAPATADPWRARAADLDAAESRVEELEAAGHPRAALLRQLCDTIRTRADAGDPQAAIAALDRMQPTLERFYAEQTQQAPDAAELADRASTEESDAPTATTPEPSAQTEQETAKDGGPTTPRVSRESSESTDPRESTESSSEPQDAESEALQQMRERNERVLGENRERCEANAQELRDQGMEAEVRQLDDGRCIVVGSAPMPENPEEAPPAIREALEHAENQSTDPDESESLRRMREHNERVLGENRERCEANAQELRDQGMEAEVRQLDDGRCIVVGSAPMPENPADAPPAIREALELARATESGEEQPPGAPPDEQASDSAAAEADGTAASPVDAASEETPQLNEDADTPAASTSDGEAASATAIDAEPQEESRAEAPERPASSRGDASSEELNEEAHQLHQRGQELLQQLNSTLYEPEYVDFENRFNTFGGRLTNPANPWSPQELRRVITDLREFNSDAEARLREVERNPDSIDDASTAEVGDRDPASGRSSTSFPQLQREAQALHQRATAFYTLNLRPRLSESERRPDAARLNSLFGRINDRELRGDTREMRRVITDLYAIIQDYERRSRELDGDTDRMIGELAEGNIEGNIDAAQPDAAEAESQPELSELPSARADATLEELCEEGEQLHAEATELYEELCDQISEEERLGLLHRINSIAGRLHDRANRRSREENRRIITDLRAILDDERARLRELQRGAPTEIDQAATSTGDGASTQRRFTREQKAAEFDQIERELDQLTAQLEE